MRVKLVIGFQNLSITIMRSPTVNHIKRPLPRFAWTQHCWIYNIFLSTCCM